MKTLKSLILIITVLLTTLSCSTSGYNKVVDNHITFDTDDLSELTFNDFYKLDTLIQLEDNESAYFGRVNNVLLSENKIIVVAGKSIFPTDYYVFDETGKFLYHQNRVGRGPGEYLTIKEVAISGDTVVVTSDKKQLYYDINDGHLLGEDKHQASRSISASYLKNGEVLKNYGNAGNNSKEDKYYAFQRFSKNGELLEGYLPMPNADTHYMSVYSTMLSTNDKIYSSPLTNSSVFEYEISSNIFKELYSLSLKGGPICDINSDSYKSSLKDRTSFRIRDAGDNYISLSFFVNKVPFFAHIEDDKVELIPFINIKNMLNIKFIFSHSDKLISIIESESGDNSKIAIYSHL